MLVVNLIGFPIGTAKYPSLVMPPPRESRKSGESISICNSLSITNVSAINELIEKGEKNKQDPNRNCMIHEIYSLNNGTNSTYCCLVSVGLHPFVYVGKYLQKAFPPAHPCTIL
jgi:hypothetical protein